MSILTDWLPQVRATSTRWAARRRRRALRIVAASERLRSLDDRVLRQLSAELTWRSRSGEPPRRLLSEAFALVREASRRTCGMVHHPVQILGGMALFSGAVAEMQTGEGKTLTALLAVYLHAIAGRGCHVVTANDYLASRDAAFAQTVLGPLGLTVGCIEPKLKTTERRREYAKDVTYGTAKEMGFDFLRDKLRMRNAGVGSGEETGAARNDARHPATPFAEPQGVPPLLSPSTALPLATRHSLFASGSTDGVRLLRAMTDAVPDDETSPVQRGHHFALIDEADSILIDDARTPLLIAVAEPPDAASLGLYRWCERAAGRLEPAIHFTLEPKNRDAHLTEDGCRRLIQLPRPAVLEGFDVERLFKQVERALVARHCFTLNRDYVVADGEVAIVDESTGRVMEGRKWQDGLHQAVEAKERIEITDTTITSARITVQSFYRSYSLLAGLTGTAAASAAEFRRAYRLPILRIPTHRPGRRKSRPVRVFVTMEQKIAAIGVEIARLIDEGRAVLVGTPSVGASERLAAALRAGGIACEVLNCRAHRREAEIVSRAGEPGRVTIATNMAGRGTDIKVQEDVLRRGGLHILATEMHSSARIDRQLVGRTARQGEPGSFQFILSLEDELLSTLPPRVAGRLRFRAAGSAGAAGELPRRWARVFRRAQRRLESLHRRQRRELLKQEQERSKACGRMGLDPCLDVVE